MKGLIKKYKLLPFEERLIITTAITMTTSALIAAGKILIGLFSDFILVVVGIFGVLLLAAKLQCVLGAKKKTGNFKARNSLIALFMLIAGLVYIFYMGRLLIIGGGSERYGTIKAIMTATIAFFEMGLAVYGLIKTKNKGHYYRDIKIISFVSGMTAIMTAQIALTSLSDKDTNFYNGITGVIIGVVTVLLAVYVYFAPQISIIDREHNAFRLCTPSLNETIKPSADGKVELVLCRSAIYSSCVYRAQMSGDVVEGDIVKTVSGFFRLRIEIKIVLLILSEILVFVWLAGYAVYFFRTVNLPRKLEALMADNGFKKIEEDDETGSYLKDLWSFLKTKEKDFLISRSGSTADDKNQRIRSGQSYLYKSRGMESEVIEVRFTDRVLDAPLNRALGNALERYPYLKTKLVEKDGDFYIVRNDVSVIATHSVRLRKLGGISCGYHLIDITYHNKSLFVSFHHALCDGRGIKPFVETLIYYYCLFRYDSRQKVEGVRLKGDALLEGETLDPFLKSYPYDKDKRFIELSRDAFHLKENKASADGVDYRYEIRIAHDKFMSVCRANNATPVILVALFMSKGIAALYPNYGKQINANIATDMREALGVPNTYKNCVKSMILPYTRDMEALPLCEQAASYRRLLQAQRDFDYCRREADRMLALFDRLDSLTSYEDKKKCMGFFENMTMDTYIVSYLGGFALGGNSARIKGIYLYNSGTSGLGITMTATDDWFTLVFKQSFSSDKYVRAFCRRLEEAGLPYEASGAIAFATPQDALVKRQKQERKAP